VTLVDASSTNGCFVNDVRVTRHRLRDGDLVRIGDRTFRFELSLSAGAAGAAGQSVRPQDDCAA
jgi:pSer/pThr/pTyr-binding forkhead associated (FHA) protein